MIISRTPLRISFCGGGSDLPAFYRHEPGAVVSTTIDKYIYITVNRKFDRKIRASYSVTEIVDSVDELKHELIRECLKLLDLKGAIEITSISDIPSQGTGLGSSSSYTVGLLNALHAYRGHHAGAERLASEACRVEIERCGRPIGQQDQWIAAYGGLQHIQFNPDGSVFVDPIICSLETKQRLQARLLLFYTGTTRSADMILEKQRADIEKLPGHREILRQLAGMAGEMREALCRDNLDTFGEILHAGWLLKQRLGPNISTAAIDEWYRRARQHGALGGKILGAGGGGFLLVYALPEYHRAIISALSELQPMEFKLAPQGSKIVYVEE